MIAIFYNINDLLWIDYEQNSHKQISANFVQLLLTLRAKS